MSFSNLTSKAELFLQNPDYCKTKEGMIDLVCRDCDFWREDERDYECGAFKLMQFLLQNGVLNVQDVIRALPK
jgi:hypothetical protein